MTTCSGVPLVSSHIRDYPPILLAAEVWKIPKVRWYKLVPHVQEVARFVLGSHINAVRHVDSAIPTEHLCVDLAFMILSYGVERLSTFNLRNSSVTWPARLRVRRTRTEDWRRQAGAQGFALDP